jgi:hypothetical protein
MSETTTLEEAPQTEAVTETQVEEQKQATGLDDPMLSQLWEDLGVEPAPEVKSDEPEKEAQPEPEKEEAPQAKAADEEPEPEQEPEAAAQKKEFSVKPKVDEDSFRQVIREELEARGKDPDKPEPVEDKPAPDPYEQQLIGEQKEELDLYRYAESKGKHSGKATKLLGFYKELDDYVEKSKLDDPGRTFDDQDSEFIEYVRRNKPNINQSDRDSLKRSKFRDEIIDDVKKEYAQTITGLKGELNEIRVSPQIKSTIKEAGRAYEEFGNMEEMKSNDPLTHKVFSEEKEKYMAWADDFVQRWHGLKSSQDEGYFKLINDIEGGAESYARSGDTIKDGKKFLTPSRYSQASDRSEYWTWDQNDILEHFGSKSLDSAKENAEKRIKELEGYGFRREVGDKLSQDGANNKPDYVNPPKSVRSASPGPVEGAVVDSDHPGKRLIDDLGINFGQ